jgi:adenylate cyclase
MVTQNSKRRLTAILVADVSNYSRLMGANELETHQQMKIHREDVIDIAIQNHEGAIVHTAGDGILAQFPSVVGAVECAIEIQKFLNDKNLKIPEQSRLNWRIGVNFGDVIVEKDDIYGDGVNVAARLEKLSEPGGLCVSDVVYREVKNRLNVTFRSIGEQWLKNISEPVHAFQLITEPDLTLPSNRSRPEPAPQVILDRPSIAVLLFANLTQKNDNQYLVEGLTEDLITDLSMSPEFFVIARSSSFSFKDGEQDLKTVGQQLGVRYLVTGSLQQDERSFRVTAQLVEAETGVQLWVGRYDRQNAELLDVRDEIVRSIAATLMTTAGPIAKAELKRQSTKAPQSFSIYDHYLKAREYFHQSLRPPWRLGKEAHEKAKAEFIKAIKMSDPPFWPLYAGLAWQYAIEFDFFYSTDTDKSGRLAFDNAKIAVKNAPENHIAQWIMGWSYLYVMKDHTRAMFHYRKARELNLGDSRLLAEMAQPLLYTGQCEQAITLVRHAIRLNPLHEQWYDEFLAWAYEESGQPGKAVEILTQFNELEGIWIYLVLARAYAQLGEMDAFQSQIVIIDELAREQMDCTFSMDFVKDWVRQREPYKESARSQRIIEIMDKALKQTGMQYADFGRKTTRIRPNV